MMATYFPELMTPELHVCVVPRPDVFRVPAMQIADDDALFGPLKATYQGLMPIMSTVALPLPPRRDDDSSDYDSDDYDYDSDDYDYDDARG
jgi:hypothetical protein